SCRFGHNVIYAGDLQSMKETDASFIDLYKENGNIVLLEFPVRPANDAVESLIRRINTHPNYLEIELKNFDQQDLTLFIDHSLGRSFDRLVDFAWECCSGHPFYSAAFLQVLQQCSDWQSNTGTGYLDFIWRDIENLDIPSGVIEHIRRRLA